MKWNLRLAAANRGIWKASELQRLLADRGLVISAGKMSGLWSGQPNTVKLDELDVICAVLGCGIAELLLPEPVAVPQPSARPSSDAVAESRAVTPRPWIGHSTSELPAGFRGDIHAWLPVLLDGDARTRPRSPATVRVHFSIVRPFIEHRAATRSHLREITCGDVDAVLSPLRGHRRYNAITALR